MAPGRTLTLIQIEHTGESDEKFLFSLLYSYTITCLEVYLQDAFLHAIKRDDLKRKFVEKSNHISIKPIGIGKIYDRLEAIDKIIAGSFENFVWHRLKSVGNLYKTTFEIDFAKIPQISHVDSGIKTRHHITHQACRDDAGNPILINKNQLVDLLNNIHKFILEIDRSYCLLIPPATIDKTPGF